MSQSPQYLSSLSIDTESIQIEYSIEISSAIKSILQDLNDLSSEHLLSPESFLGSLNSLQIITPENLNSEDPNKQIHQTLHNKIPPWRLSEVLTSAKDSFIDPAKPNLHNTSFAIPNKMFCSSCLSEVYTKVTFESSFPDFWETLFKRFKCCNSPNSAKQAVIHNCGKCKKVLVRISAD